MLDEYVWGQVSRLSPEAPVPIVEVVRETQYPGGAANVARNLRQFAGQVHILGRVGEDTAGQRLREALAAEGIATDAVLTDPEVCTTVKTRVVARQQLLRVDRERRTMLGQKMVDRAASVLKRLIPTVDAVIVSDYHKGFLGQELADRLGQWCQENGVILAIDPNPDNPLRWPGATVIKPNRAEALAAAGVTIDGQRDAGREDEILCATGTQLLDRWQPQFLLVTAGEKGMLLFQQGQPVFHTAVHARAVFDVSGAGDTAISLFTLALAAGATPAEAAELANCASSIVVGKLGTATTNAGEIDAFLSGHE